VPTEKAPLPIDAPKRTNPIPLTVVFAYVGPVGDAGWSYAHERGRKAVEAEFRDRVKTVYVASVPEDSRAEPVFREAVSRGAKLVFGTSFGYMEPMAKIAQANRDVRFEHASGFRTSQNMRTYDSRMYEGAYLAGIVAGASTKSGTIGVVASVPIPEILLNINSFSLGAQSVNPRIQTRVAWVGSWFNPQKETAATQSLIDQSADVLFQNTDSSAVVETAQRNGKKAIGWVSDYSAFGKDAHLASAIVDWGPYYKKAVSDVLNGTWQSGHAWWGVKEGAIDLAALSDQVEPDTRRRIAVVKAGLKDGSFHPWKGPVVDQAGKTVVKKDQVPDDKFMLGINFYVKGVDGKVPNDKK
jgi:basic membrane protein A and related proteins